jgi:phage FluMu protein Com
MDRPTERHIRCPHCKVPRFLAGIAGPLSGNLRVPCVKCRTTTVFNLETAKPILALVEIDHERELRCGACRWFLAGVVVASGEGTVRVPCVKKGCKRNNTFHANDRSIQSDVKVPVA